MSQLWDYLRKAFATGLLVLLPLAITLWVVFKLVKMVDGLLDIAPAAIHPEHLVGQPLPGLGILITLFVVLAVGAGMRWYAVSAVVEAYEALLARVPVLSGVYQGLKQLFNTLFSSQQDHFRQVVMVEYPRRGCWAVAFVTSRVSFLPADEDGQKLVSLFLPTTPNPTSGFYLVVPREDVRELDLSVEEAFKLIMSAGIVQPDGLRPPKPLGASPETQEARTQQGEV